MRRQTEILREPHRAGQHVHPHEWRAEKELPPVSAWYQPKIALATGKIIGVEALARVIDPVLGALSPAALLESATPSMHERLTHSILAQALAAQREWVAAGYPLTVSVNVPASMIGQRTAREHLLQTVRESGVTPPESIVLEILETCSADENAALPEATKELRAYGLGLAIDDFGIGHSSLLRLMQCQFTELKIDRAFVHDAANYPKVRAALDACVLLGKRLGLRITAEGVETAADLEVVSAAGCDFMQGFVVSQALPEQLLMDLLSRGQPANALLV